MRRWMGIDVNGWHDVAARDWNAEDPDEPCPAPVEVDGGIQGVAVRDISERWIGGPQALLSPHGRGSGWGDVGLADRRRTVADVLRGVLASEPWAEPALQGVVDALTRGAESLMVGVPDEHAFGESAQGRMLEALRGRGRPRPLLLWRSVALFLQGLETGIINRESRGLRVTVLIHAAGGLEMQTLTLADAVGFPGHQAPERDGYGQLVLPELGLTALLQRCEPTVMAMNPVLAEGRIERSRLPIHLLCSAEAPEEEILRRDNGTWAKATAAPVDSAAFVPEVPTSWAPPTADLTLLSSPLAPALTAALARRLSPRIPNLHVLPWGGIARGALAAGRMVERGLPHYLDRLEPISLAVLGREDASWQPLIPQDSNVPANREFVSEPITGFIWGGARERIEFYVLKGSAQDGEVRHWATEERSPPGRDMPVTIQLRQMPGQSWAKLEVTSTEWSDLTRSPIRLDWETLKPDLRPPAEILETLRRPRPVVPNRVVERPNIGFWDGSLIQPSVTEALRQDLDALVRALSQSRRAEGEQPSLRRIRPVGTDGDLPAELPDDIRMEFLGRIQELAADLQAQMQDGAFVADSGGFRCLTWSFTLCPEQVQDHILDALDAQNRGKPHPLLRLRAANTLLQQGAGRSVDGVERISRLLRLLSERPRKNAHTWAAYSFILTRRAAAPSALDQHIVDEIAGELAEWLKAAAQSGDFRNRYKYLLSAAAGLLRYRQIEPWALLAERSAIAAGMQNSLQCCHDALTPQLAKLRQGKEKLAATEGLIELLGGTGGDPDLLMRIEDLE